jgi:hypothetical protein
MHLFFFGCWLRVYPSQTLYSASFLVVLKRFRYDAEKLDGEKVHPLFNVMTMQRDVYYWFNRLGLWFEATVSI